MGTIICLQDSDTNASLVDIVELDILPGKEPIRADQIAYLMTCTSHVGNTA